jgi:hypothetical protein
MKNGQKAVSGQTILANSKQKYKIGLTNLKA